MNWVRRFLVGGFTSFLFLFSAHAQQVDIAWTRSPIEPSLVSFRIVDMTLDGMGNSYVVGEAGRNVNGVGSSDYLITKYTANGDMAWTTYFDSTNATSYATGVCVDSAGNIGVTGTDFSFENTAHFVTLKLSPSGGILWQRRFGPGYAYDIATDGFGNFYVTGSGSGAMLVKYGPNGDSLWSTITPGGHPWNIALDEFGNAYTTGVYVNGGNADIQTIKFANGGGAVWSHTYDGPFQNNEWGYAIALDQDGNACVTGQSVTGDNVREVVTIKYHTFDGHPLWVRTFVSSGKYGDIGRDVAVDSDGNIYVSGRGIDAVRGHALLTLKYSSSGTLRWHRAHYGLGRGGEAYGIGLDSRGDIYVSGCADDGTGIGRPGVVKYDRNGNIFWSSFIPSLQFRNRETFGPLVVDSTKLFFLGNATTVYRIDQTYCCQGQRGDLDLSGSVDALDLSLLIAFFVGNSQSIIACGDEANISGGERIDISDLSFLISYLTMGTGPLPNCP